MDSEVLEVLDLVLEQLQKDRVHVVHDHFVRGKKQNKELSNISTEHCNHNIVAQPDSENKNT